MFSNPEKNVAQLGLQEGMKVADFGSGAGFYLRALSKRVGPSGKVFAIEVQKNLIKKIESDIKIWGIDNVSCIWGDIEKIDGTKIMSGSLDAVIISNVLYQAEDKIGLIDEAKRILKKGGKILFIDFNKDGFPFIKKEEASNLFLKRGFKILENIEVSDSHYGIIFKYE